MLAPPNLYYLLAIIALILCVILWARYRRSPTVSFYFKVSLLIAGGIVLKHSTAREQLADHFNIGIPNCPKFGQSRSVFPLLFSIDNHRVFA
jgi:hypothetical protein